VSRSESSVLRVLTVGLIVAVATLTAYLTLAQRIADPDQFWHIATGRWIVEHGSVPTHDVFSWWAMENNREWAAHEWLFGVLIYGVWSLGGFAAVYWFTATLEGAAVAVAYALTRARGVSPLMSVLAAITVAFGTMYWVAPRPQMVSFVLIPLVALLLQKDKWPWALAVIVLGVNIHGAIWPLYVLVFALFEFPKRWWLVLAATGASLVNPNPVGTFLFAFGGFTNPLAERIAEFVPTALWKRKGDLAVFVALIVLTRMKRIPWKDGLFALAFSVLALTAVRHLQWLYLLVVPILAPHIASGDWQAASSRFASRLPMRLRSHVATAMGARPENPAETDDASATAEDRPADASRLPGGLRLLQIVLATALAIAVLLLSASVSRQTLDVDRWYPKDMIAYLKLHKAKRIFNIWHEGGYLIFNGIQPLIDGRGDPYVAQKPGQRNLVAAYMDVELLVIDPMPFFDELKVDYALLTASPLLTVLSSEPRLELVKTDEYHALFKVLPKQSASASASVEPTGTADTPLARWLRDAANRARPPSE
jgi:hypothetical protein